MSFCCFFGKSLWYTSRMEKRQKKTHGFLQLLCAAADAFETLQIAFHGGHLAMLAMPAGDDDGKMLGTWAMDELSSFLGTNMGFVWICDIVTRFPKFLKHICHIFHTSQSSHIFTYLHTKNWCHLGTRCFFQEFLLGFLGPATLPVQHHHMGTSPGLTFTWQWRQWHCHFTTGFQRAYFGPQLFTAAGFSFLFETKGKVFSPCQPRLWPKYLNHKSMRSSSV